MRNFFAITRNTFTEVIREPIFCILLLCSASLIALLPALSLFVFDAQIKMVIDSSLATTTFIGLLTAVLCASQTVTREMRDGTVLLLLAKPVARASFVLGKITGITSAAMVFVWICNAMTVISLYVATDQFWYNFTLLYSTLAAIILAAVIALAANFWRDYSFAGVFSFVLLIFATAIVAYCLIFLEEERFKLQQGFSMVEVAKVLLLIFFAVAAMSVIAVIFALKFELVANLCICTLIFFIGLISGHIFAPVYESQFLNFICSFCYAVAPNWQFFWLADALAGGRPVPWSYVGAAALYVVLYISLGCLWAVTLFQTQEAAKDARV